MANDGHYRKLENMYLSARCNEYYRPSLTISEGHAVWTMAVRECMFHAAGALHGSAYFKAMDDAAFFAANSLVEDVFVLTASFTVHFTRPVTSGVIRATADVVHASRNLILADSVLVDSEERPIGRGTGSFMRSQIPLTPDVGYQS